VGSSTHLLPHTLHLTLTHTLALTAAGTQAPTCSNLTPLQFTVLSEKLDAAGYESHFIGKGHLGYQTTDHLPVYSARFGTKCLHSRIVVAHAPDVVKPVDV
jgi:hypothetical protein